MAILETFTVWLSHMHVVLTGRRCPPKIIALADTETEYEHGQARVQGRHSSPARHRGLRG
jgi:ATP:corrinoid adenosyltransferase